MIVKLSISQLLMPVVLTLLDYQYFCQWYVTSTFLLDIQNFQINPQYFRKGYRNKLDRLI
jgi:hypothetical protein